MSFFVNSIFNAEREKLMRAATDLRYYRNTAELQEGFAVAVESFGMSRPLMLVASRSPELMSLFAEDQVPSMENLNVVGDKSVHVNGGLGEKTLKSAGIADWLDDTRDSLSGFCETANYHMAGIQRRCGENGDRIMSGSFNPSARVNAPSFENRRNDIDRVNRAIEIVNSHWDEEPDASVDAMAAELVHVTGICKMNDDYETTPEGMYCLERFQEGSLSSLGYTEDNLRQLLSKVEYMLAGARHLVDRGGDLITARYDADEPKHDEHDDDHISEEVKTAKTEPDESENIQGRYDVEHPDEHGEEYRVDDPDAPMPHVPVKADPFEHELSNSNESLEDLVDRISDVNASFESLQGEISFEDLLNRQSDEVLTDVMSKMANRVTLITCLIDCATHLGLHLLYISDEALKNQ